MSDTHLERVRAAEFPNEEQKIVALVFAHFANGDGAIPARIFDGVYDGRIKLHPYRCACGGLSRVEARSLGLTIATVDAGHVCTDASAEPDAVAVAGGVS